MYLFLQDMYEIIEIMGVYICIYIDLHWNNDMFITCILMY